MKKNKINNILLLMILMVPSFAFGTKPIIIDTGAGPVTFIPKVAPPQPQQVQPQQPAGVYQPPVVVQPAQVQPVITTIPEEDLSKSEQVDEVNDAIGRLTAASFNQVNFPNTRALVTYIGHIKGIHKKTNKVKIIVNLLRKIGGMIAVAPIADARQRNMLALLAEIEEQTETKDSYKKATDEFAKEAVRRFNKRGEQEDLDAYYNILNQYTRRLTRQEFVGNKHRNKLKTLIGHLRPSRNEEIRALMSVLMRAALLLREANVPGTEKTKIIETLQKLSQQNKAAFKTAFEKLWTGRDPIEKGHYYHLLLNHIQHYYSENAKRFLSYTKNIEKAISVLDYLWATDTTKYTLIQIAKLVRMVGTSDKEKKKLVRFIVKLRQDLQQNFHNALAQLLNMQDLEDLRNLSNLISTVTNHHQLLSAQDKGTFIIDTLLPLINLLKRGQQQTIQLSVNLMANNLVQNIVGLVDGLNENTRITIMETIVELFPDGQQDNKRLEIENLWRENEERLRAAKKAPAIIPESLKPQQLGLRVFAANFTNNNYRQHIEPLIIDLAAIRGQGADDKQKEVIKNILKKIGSIFSNRGTPDENMYNMFNFLVAMHENPATKKPYDKALLSLAQGSQDELRLYNNIFNTFVKTQDYGSFVDDNFLDYLKTWISRLKTGTGKRQVDAMKIVLLSAGQLLSAARNNEDAKRAIIVFLEKLRKHRFGSFAHKNPFQMALIDLGESRIPNYNIVYQNIFAAQLLYLLNTPKNFLQQRKYVLIAIKRLTGARNKKTLAIKETLEHILNLIQNKAPTKKEANKLKKFAQKLHTGEYRGSWTQAERTLLDRIIAAGAEEEAGISLGESGKTLWQEFVADMKDLYKFLKFPKDKAELGENYKELGETISKLFAFLNKKKQQKEMFIEESNIKIIDEQNKLEKDVEKKANKLKDFFERIKLSDENKAKWKKVLEGIKVTINTGVRPRGWKPPISPRKRKGGEKTFEYEIQTKEYPPLEIEGVTKKEPEIQVVPIEQREEFAAEEELAEKLQPVTLKRTSYTDLIKNKDNLIGNLNYVKRHTPNLMPKALTNVLERIWELLKEAAHTNNLDQAEQLLLFEKELREEYASSFQQAFAVLSETFHPDINEELNQTFEQIRIKYPARRAKNKGQTLETMILDLNSLERKTAPLIETFNKFQNLLSRVPSKNESLKESIGSHTNKALPLLESLQLTSQKTLALINKLEADPIYKAFVEKEKAPRGEQLLREILGEGYLSFRRNLPVNLNNILYLAEKAKATNWGLLDQIKNAKKKIRLVIKNDFVESQQIEELEKIATTLGIAEKAEVITNYKEQIETKFTDIEHLLDLVKIKNLNKLIDKLKDFKIEAGYREKATLAELQKDMSSFIRNISKELVPAKVFINVFDDSKAKPFYKTYMREIEKTQPTDQHIDTLSNILFLITGLSSTEHEISGYNDFVTKLSTASEKSVYSIEEQIFLNKHFVRRLIQHIIKSIKLKNIKKIITELNKLKLPKPSMEEDFPQLVQQHTILSQQDIFIDVPEKYIGVKEPGRGLFQFLKENIGDPIQEWWEKATQKEVKKLLPQDILSLEKKKRLETEKKKIEIFEKSDEPVLTEIEEKKKTAPELPEGWTEKLIEDEPVSDETIERQFKEIESEIPEIGQTKEEKKTEKELQTRFEKIGKQAEKYLGVFDKPIVKKKEPKEGFVKRKQTEIDNKIKTMTNKHNIRAYINLNLRFQKAALNAARQQTRPPAVINRINDLIDYLNNKKGLLKK